ncbi:MAG: VWA domain-containing protein [Candidatus Levybacteria bacterium]|nr:VWA domain-containing protein [Candidatus Levybacteria bacterium]
MIKNLSKILKNSRGGAEILILVIIILGSVLLTGGFFPKIIPPDPNAPRYTEISEIQPDSQKTLQLKTIKFKGCTSIVAVDFLVDRSGSMRYGTKLDNLKNALNVFAGSFPEDGIIGMQSYSEPSFGPTADVPIDYFKNVKSQFLSAVSSLFPNGGTYSKDAFSFTKPLLDSARAKFPDHKFSLIFISDGVPETWEGTRRLCPDGPATADQRYCGPKPDNPTQCRCFDTNQDPTSVANEIKLSGVRIFTIGYIHDEDLKFQDDLRTLMTNTASSPTDFYEAPIDNQLTDILSQISQKLCN